MNARMKVELLEEATFSARAGEVCVPGLRVTGEWKGLRELTDASGRNLIIDHDGTVFKGTYTLLHELRLLGNDDAFITVPATHLPGGIVVPAFELGQYAASKGSDGRAQMRADGKPWVNINFSDAKQACADAGYKLITELQWLAIAHQIWHQPENWTGGAVGSGTLYRGLHKGTVSSAQDGRYESQKPEERRWHVLANGQRVYDMAGNVWQWVFDNVQGDAEGKISKSISVDSPSRAVAPADCQKLGGGWQPEGQCTWSGDALVRGGCWFSGDSAGVFGLIRDWPGRGYGSVSFRCTK